MRHRRGLDSGVGLLPLAVVASELARGDGVGGGRGRWVTQGVFWLGGLLWLKHTLWRGAARLPLAAIVRRARGVEIEARFLQGVARRASFFEQGQKVYQQCRLTTRAFSRAHIYGAVLWPFPRDARSAGATASLLLHSLEPFLGAPPSSAQALRSVTLPTHRKRRWTQLHLGS